MKAIVRASVGFGIKEEYDEIENIQYYVLWWDDDNEGGTVEVYLDAGQAAEVIHDLSNSLGVGLGDDVRNQLLTFTDPLNKRL